MRARGRVRPSKPVSAIGMIVGIVFIGVGILVVIPQAGGFGVVWTLLAVAITVYYAINVFSSRGLAHEVVEFDTSASRPPEWTASTETTEQRLRELESLRDKGLVTGEEYEEQRKRILDGL